ncbi:hypothetical protein [Moorena sp. SIO3B2]|uniref:hypothetical protein n=1 Tax=Moorena sp. SIO3B2 TaxID=2607827 RepID=UPI0013C65A03|nr:hypothetical protein [Moorena sp. SIO3B2]NEP33669.1 hypothetical protein [Moorena sp. SIO3B2]
MAGTTAVVHGGNPQDRAASPRPRYLTASLLKLAKTSHIYHIYSIYYIYHTYIIYLLVYKSQMHPIQLIITGFAMT